MRYEILPGYAIMTACLMVPGLSTILIHRYAFGKDRRVARYPHQLYLMERDRRVFGE
ncbi:NADH dehydrogenase [ubiquinone] 1 alpha subcomplex subunit 1-like [Rana temporaria]|uniref:NADH dehydrogenase [ubiquinone] 1 alpha subcomplex subunit 1-like n=1 Tax=Rana temporaria TaxID=8407 RepID=UPI001AADC13D|nr:NADH dehydrogenase [ubiquinone] 1 alpha subcomplex subunit 1-like [Rana temporaria]